MRKHSRVVLSTKPKFLDGRKSSSCWLSQHALPGVVEVNEGAESVLLPCRYSGFIEDNPTVLWTRSDLSPTSVHLQGEKGALKEQNQRYRGRTSVMSDAFDTSDFSLTLRKPELSDSGDYTCSFRDDRATWWVADVQLMVKDHQVEVKVTEGAESVILPCRTTPDLPKDVTVEWTHSDPDLMMVHVYPNTSKDFMKQSIFHRDRTEMFKDLLSSGDVSLTLKHPTDRDTGSYICTVYRDKDILRQKVVLMHGKEPFPSWATAVLVPLVLVLVISAGVLYHFRFYFMSVCQVEVEEGAESVLLPFRTTPDLPGDAEVEWWRLEPKPRIYCHVYQDGSDQPGKQDQVYRNRTKMNQDPLKTGDFSLILDHPKHGDSGRYRCGVKREGGFIRYKTVLLNVKGRVQVQDQRTSGTEADPTPLMADQSV
ncbi:butyrophilin subfamily 1 member A1-like [Melanotaenia boesemani]|uniref:butyrophilin subfamily 1 member A1-like n=1 Tax=Melanotaenia boesemani TaxID=1250792 RepID=UPI001C046082|nr:butyrophilin subfamily 1 member A1-like [Melanotaenia boesemani]